MMEFLKRAIAPRGLGLAFTLAVIPYLCRVDNAFMWMLESHSAVAPFEVSLLVGVVVGCAVALFVPVGPAARQAKETLGGALLVVAGIVVAGFIEVLPSFPCAIASGLLMGLGFVASLRQWFVMYAPLSTEAALTTASLALLLASAVWYAVRHTNNFYVLCLCLGVCAVCGGLVCLVFLALDIRGDRLAVDRDDAVTSPDAEPASLELPCPRWISFAGAGALWFNFFTLGLTMYNETAGTSPDNITNKMLPYAVVAVAIIGVTFLLVRRKAGFTFFLASILAIGAAIELASPFIDDLFTPGSLFYSTFSYAGVALFNVLGFALPLRGLKETGRTFNVAFAGVMIGSVLVMDIGILVFQALGESGQLVSLCVMTVYLVVLVLAAMNTSSNASAGKKAAETAPADPAEQDATPEAEAPLAQEEAPAPAPEPAPAAAAAAAAVPAEPTDPRKLACELLAERYQLSPRESEVLWLLARGYGARYIGERLFISADTVRTHCKRIYEKVGVHNKEELLEIIESFESAGSAGSPE